MPESIGLPDPKRLIAEGVQRVDVLSPEEYAEELDHGKPIAVHCHDAL
jgi:hypothetical protein